jgi:hypothetical protein
MSGNRGGVMAWTFSVYSRLTAKAWSKYIYKKMIEQMQQDSYWTDLNSASEKMTNASHGWYECPDCRCLHPTKKGAEECCKGRHSKSSKEPTLNNNVSVG